MSSRAMPKISRPRPLFIKRQLSNQHFSRIVFTPLPTGQLSPSDHATKPERDKGRMSSLTINTSLIEDILAPKLCRLSASNFNLDDAFPAPLKPMTLKRLLSESQTPSDVDAVTAAFAQCMDALMEDMERLPLSVRLNNHFELARNGVLFTKDLFVHQTSQISTDLSDADLKEKIEFASDLLEMNVASLKSLLEIAKHAMIQEKPLPNLPGDSEPDTSLELDIEESPREFSSSSMEDCTDGSLATAEISDREPIMSTADEQDNDPPATPSSRKNSIFTRLLSRASKVQVPSLNLNAQSFLTFLDIDFNTNSASPVDPPQSPQSDSETLVCERASPIDQTIPKLRLRAGNARGYTIRDSLFVFPDPAAPECDVQMPRPDNDAFDIQVNNDGVVIKASLTALIVMLTSKECVTDYEFMDMFFLCFRYFSSPMEVYNKLVARYNEPPGDNLSEAQMRVWEREAISIKLRVAKALHTWVDLHWRQGLDHEVHEHLLEFAFKRIAPELPICLSTQITEVLTRCAADLESYRGRRVERRIMIAKLALGMNIPPPTFIHPLRADMCEGDFWDVDVLDFNTAEGRKELARQLTLKVSEMYCLIDPEEAVAFWRGQWQGDDKVGEQISAMISFEKALFAWVIHTILTPSTPKDRAIVYIFWLEIASVSDSLI
jgi:RasGEF N-terminal motif/RasGEF domain